MQIWQIILLSIFPESKGKSECDNKINKGKKVPESDVNHYVNPKRIQVHADNKNNLQPNYVTPLPQETKRR